MRLRCIKEDDELILNKIYTVLDFSKERVRVNLKNNWNGYYSIENIKGIEKSPNSKQETYFEKIDEYDFKQDNTFEYNGFICKTIERCERWVYDRNEKRYLKVLDDKNHYKEIEDCKFIKQLEENAL